MDQTRNDDGHLVALGRLASRTNALQMLVAALFDALVNPANLDIGRRLRTGATFGRVLELLKSIIPTSAPPAAQQPLLTWLGKVNSVKDLRDKYLHSAWFNTTVISAAGTDSALVRNWLNKKDGLPEVEDFEVAELDSAADQAVAAYFGGVQIVAQVYNALVKPSGS